VILFFDPGDLQIALERLGIPVLFLSAPETIEGVLEQITLLGKVTARNDEASVQRTDLKARIDAVTDKLKNATQGPRIFHELDATLFTTCPGEFIHDMYVKLKARNIATSAGLPCQLSQEALIAADPQVIILADEPAGVTPQSVKGRSGWANITAIKNGAIYTVDADIFSRPGPRIVDAFEQLAKLLYPDTFR